MNSLFLPSILALGGLGLFFGAGLAYAARKFAVEVDPRVEKVLDILPGVNCGACGQPGCSAYAEAVVAGRVPPNQCAPGGPEVTSKIAQILGITGVEAAEAKVAVVCCQGGRSIAEEKFDYSGLEDCRAAELIGGGSKACRFGCLGLGSCVRACPFDAMVMTEEGLPRVLEDKCTACGICVTTCPRGIMQLIPKEQKVYLGCVSQDRAKAVKSVCKVGCFACKICAMPKVSPSGSIVMEGNLPEIKSPFSDELFLAYKKCPSKSYVLRGELPDSITEAQDEKGSKADG